LAFSFACIRVEELTKILLLMEMRSGHHDRESWSRFWKKFREHRAKWSEYRQWRFQQDGVTDEQTARELGEVFSAWVRALMAGKPMPEPARPNAAETARREKRVILRLKPYATFETPPWHVYKEQDTVGLTHWLGQLMPW
jgi:hypothetical protein